MSEMDGAVRLPATAWAVLGLLSFPGERSGYDLKKWADNSLRFFYESPAPSQIYAELKRLERLGLASSRTAAQDDLRNKRLYRITDAGREALREWAATPADPPLLKHGPALRVWLGHLSDPGELRRTVREHRDWAERTRVETQASQDVAHQHRGWAYPELVLRWGARYYAAERDLADQLLADLDDLADATDRPADAAGEAADCSPDAAPDAAPDADAPSDRA